MDAGRALFARDRQRAALDQCGTAVVITGVGNRQRAGTGDGQTGQAANDARPGKREIVAARHGDRIGNEGAGKGYARRHGVVVEGDEVERGEVVARGTGGAGPRHGARIVDPGRRAGADPCQIGEIAGKRHGHGAVASRAIVEGRYFAPADRPRREGERSAVAEIAAVSEQRIRSARRETSGGGKKRQRGGAAKREVAGDLEQVVNAGRAGAIGEVETQGAAAGGGEAGQRRTCRRCRRPAWRRARSLRRCPGSPSRRKSSLDRSGHRR